MPRLKEGPACVATHTRSIIDPLINWPLINEDSQRRTPTALLSICREVPAERRSKGNNKIYDCLLFLILYLAVNRFLSNAYNTRNYD